MRWTSAKWLKRWVSRRPRGSTPWPGWPASRLILALFEPGELFIAIHGPRHDGHDFVAGALAGGAAAGVVARERAVGIRDEKFAENSLSSTTRSTRLQRLASRACESVAEGETGTKDRRAWRARSARPPQKKFWRRWWARGSAF